MMNIREYYEKDGQALPGKKVGRLSNLDGLDCTTLRTEGSFGLMWYGANRCVGGE